tara:strand:+ start:3897 stop:4157 length:261 start_codon:yes stop_codon:yes gene_type:complete
MVWTFKYGFDYKGFSFGWKDKALYRLPSEKNLKNYPLKILSIIKVGNKEGYRVVREKKTIDQLKEITEVINYKYVINGGKSKDCPF